MSFPFGSGKIAVPALSGSGEPAATDVSWYLMSRAASKTTIVGGAIPDDRDGWRHQPGVEQLAALHREFVGAIGEHEGDELAECCLIGP
ncbi:hypothetical protein [Amycolatopsis sp. NPDC051061]|uniref:hypothetical protein n=1 Tax=Amycolatopsis sp. NPDC051061 TaxID=3155042 RepID=UPI003437751D